MLQLKSDKCSTATSEKMTWSTHEPKAVLRIEAFFVKGSETCKRKKWPQKKILVQKWLWRGNWKSGRVEDFASLPTSLFCLVWFYHLAEKVDDWWKWNRRWVEMKLTMVEINWCNFWWFSHRWVDFVREPSDTCDSWGWSYSVYLSSTLSMSVLAYWNNWKMSDI